jgi:hypothetical protein
MACGNVNCYVNVLIKVRLIYVWWPIIITAIFRNILYILCYFNYCFLYKIEKNLNMCDKLELIIILI